VSTIQSGHYTTHSNCGRAARPVAYVECGGDIVLIDDFFRLPVRLIGLAGDHAGNAEQPPRAVIGPGAGRCAHVKIAGRIGFVERRAVGAHGGFDLLIDRAVGLERILQKAVGRRPGRATRCGLSSGGIITPRCPGPALCKLNNANLVSGHRVWHGFGREILRSLGEADGQPPALSRPVSGLIIKIPRDAQGAWSCRLELTYVGCGSPHALSRLFARAGAWGAFSSARRPGGTWLRELRPPWIPLSKAAIGRPLSRMPVIIRSHESSPGSINALQRAGIKIAQQFAKPIDIKRHYFSNWPFPSPT
jgi:hypothetical protein